MIRRLAICAAYILLVGSFGFALWLYLSRTDGSIGTDLHTVALRFTHPWTLLALVLAPLALYRMTWGGDKRAARVWVGASLPLRRAPRGLRARFRDAPAVLRAVAVTFAIIALARPTRLNNNEAGEERGIDIMLVLDLSLSMEAVFEGGASVSRPGESPRKPTRLDTAKDVIVDFVARRKNDRLGVVVFGRSAYILSPPTLDKALLANLVSHLELGVVDGTGTAIGDALGAGVARLRRSDARSKVVVLLTDGDSNAGAVSPEYATHLAQSQNVRVYTVQIGNGDDAEVLRGVDRYGEPVYARERYPVNPALLKKISHDTGAESYIATDRKGLESSMHAILDKLEKSTLEASRATYEELFWVPLGIAVVLLFFELLLRAFVFRRFP